MDHLKILVSELFNGLYHQASSG